ncbi:hypothetical protein [Brevibacterium aurantiacum]|nr:hypothetical protein [Brevibacterium aurantiacum]
MVVDPDVARGAPEIGGRVPGDPEGRFVHAVDGHAIALTGPHDQSYERP